MLEDRFQKNIEAIAVFGAELDESLAVVELLESDLEIEILFSEFFFFFFFFFNPFSFFKRGPKIVGKLSNLSSFVERSRRLNVLF